eukprot:525878-Prorocentrum_minimum.AAC.1
MRGSGCKCAGWGFGDEALGSDVGFGREVPASDIWFLHRMCGYGVGCVLGVPTGRSSSLVVSRLHRLWA